MERDVITSDVKPVIKEIEKKKDISIDERSIIRRIGENNRENLNEMSVEELDRVLLREMYRIRVLCKMIGSNDICDDIDDIICKIEEN